MDVYGQTYELISSPAADGIENPQAAAYRFCYYPQQVVRDLMTVLVVDALEIIHIGKENAERQPVSFQFLQFGINRHLGIPPVSNLGEGVDQRHLFKLLDPADS